MRALNESFLSYNPAIGTKRATSHTTEAEHHCDTVIHSHMQKCRVSSEECVCNVMCSDYSSIES